MKDNREIKIMNGCEAVAHVAYAFSEVIVVYPITPSTEISENVEKMIIKNKKNLFKEKAMFFVSQSESGTAGALHGAAVSGALASTFTCSQGLLLMIPNIYKFCGEFLPIVIHVTSRTVARHALSIFGDHSDIHACRQTGIAMLCASNVQEAMDFSVIAHLSAISSSFPFIHFFDGFRTSHELCNIKVWDYKTLSEFIDYNVLRKFKETSLNPLRNIIKGTNQNDDIYFQFLEAGNKKYSKIVKNVCAEMEKINRKIGSSYKIFNYYGDPKADMIIIAMGSVCGTIEETIDFLIKNKIKAGLIKVRLYRPFESKLLIESLPKSVVKITVLDKTKEPGSIWDPLFTDVVNSLDKFNIKNIEVFGGRYGISSKDIDNNDILSIFENMKSNDKKYFTVGINDDLTNLSLEKSKLIFEENEDLVNVQFWGIGSDGAIGATKSSTKIIGENTNLNVLGHFQYDPKKSGGLTISHLKFSKNMIKSSCNIKKTDFLISHYFEFANKYDFTKKMKPNSVFLLNSPYDKLKTLEKINFKLINFIFENNIKFFILKTNEMKINIAMQTAFFKISNIIDFNKVKNILKKCVSENYKSKGSEIIDQNIKTIDLTEDNIKLIDQVLIKKFLRTKNKENNIDYKNMTEAINLNRGNELPTSAFLDFANGNIINDNAKFHKKNSLLKPEWIPENCIQCGLCNAVCPHGVIRSFGLNNEELEKCLTKNKLLKNIKMLGFDDLNFIIEFKYDQCTGCGICSEICPGKINKSAIEMKKSRENKDDIVDFLNSYPEKEEIFKKFSPQTIKGIQFKEPLMLYGSACSGCGQTAYVRLITQLFGERLFIANATGCSSIWGGSVNQVPYKKGKHGFSPAWANSLFEDNAEFGLGFLLAQKSIRLRLLNIIKTIMITTHDYEIKKSCENYINTFDIGHENHKYSLELINVLKNKKEDITYDMCNKIILEKEYLSKKSIWAIGGDGWAYDIGFGGIDHIMASQEDINILVLDTEMYSNTGGQQSKSTPKYAKASLSLGYKKSDKKDLISMMMIYKNVYAAKVNLNANPHQCIQVFTEAEKFKGPSLIVAYSPCVGHKVNSGQILKQAKDATFCGHWQLFRFNSGKLAIDSEITKEYKKFIENENRFKKF
ncbi:MAG: pyruvate:ferredoxin (flavodoxin) oxidoreductase [Candidatus Improbicoccus pseudotrichonymphae]|uniref:Pyruvate:ferredoxin (Flavodoxin) oxidoreductase n=1 Tax=Candidatus Improbicoccus pseudotrichonymphae TaxID=3033792 RepID=A0AA48HYW0_9FIRM|nr:MAG: pyruvate:ferredoxin (flavodoxin) oxidoreductase [Candidatus Improbicoccus pseudotrichonymphae]